MNIGESTLDLFFSILQVETKNGLMLTSTTFPSKQLFRILKSLSDALELDHETILMGSGISLVFAPRRNRLHQLCVKYG